MGRRRGKKVEKERRASVETRELLALFRESRKPLSGREIFKALGVDRSGRASVRDGLTELLESGTIIQIRNAFGLAERMRLVTGVMEVHRGGIGFVLPDDPRRKDVFVPAHDMAGAWHGDRVVVAIVRERKDRRAEGRVVRILERGRKTLTAKVLKRMGQVFLCRPTDPRLDFGVMAAPRDKGLKPEPGLIVTLEPGEQVEFRLWEGEILDVLGPEEDVAVQEALVKTNHAVPTRFPSPALDQAEALPEAPGPEDFRGREDLRGLPFVTIDGATARDFDDAVFVESRGRAFRLWVAIADVAHYVRPGTPLDREAEERGNSYYFPRSVEPMFPERLSNGLCSLNPNTPRLAMAVRLDCSAKGVPGDFSVFPAVIESHGRLTYGQVKRALLDKDEEERKGLGPLLPMLEKAERLARLMNARRSERGSLDFDLPEPEILFNLSGETEDIRPKVRHFGHQIIEEFMIAANEAVATFLSERELPCLYRVHPEPDADKLKNLFQLLARTDGENAGKRALPKEITPSDLQALLDEVEGTEREFLVNRLMLRSMMQARYSPVNEGHFGLASECYCHFTSPIRRYADLVVHRLVKTALSGAGQTRDPIPAHKALAALGTHLSRRERTAMEAEREILKRVTVLFLKDKVGRTFSGVISSLMDFGFWVELGDVLAEGMVRLSSLDDDYYTYMSDREMIVGGRTGRIFRLGQAVEVVLEDVNLERLEVNLVLARGAGGKSPRRGGKWTSRA